MNPVEHLAAIRRRWRLIFATALAGVIAAFAATPADPGEAPQEYRATHTLLLRATETPGAAGGGQAARSDTQVASTAALVTSTEVAKRVAARLEFTGDPGSLLRHIKADTDPKASTIDVVAIQRDPQRAADLADAFATELVGYLDERGQAERQKKLSSDLSRMQQLQRDSAKLDAQIAAIGVLSPNAEPLRAQRDAFIRQYGAIYEGYQELVAAGTATSGLTSLKEAVPERVSPGLKPPRTRAGRMVLAAVLALLLGVGLTLVVERFDSTVRTKEDAESVTGLPVLAEIPTIPVARRRSNELLTFSRPMSVVAEAYRSLRTSLLLMQLPSGGGGNGHASEEAAAELAPHVVLVTSPSPREGKTTTAANLAASFAEAGRRVLVIDCDFRHPQLEKYFEVDVDRKGLSDVLMDLRGGPTLADVAVNTSVPGVRMIPVGTAVDNPAELFAQGREILSQAAGLAEIVILDSPPILAINDAAELVPIVDATVMVCRSGRTSEVAASRAAELLERIGAPVRGIVLAAATEAPSARGYYYYYYRAEHRNRSWWQRIVRPRPRSNDSQASGPGVTPRRRASKPADSRVKSGKSGPVKGAKSGRVRHDRPPAPSGQARAEAKRPPSEAPAARPGPAGQTAAEVKRPVPAPQPVPAPTPEQVFAPPERASQSAPPAAPSHQQAPAPPPPRPDPALEPSPPPLESIADRPAPASPEPISLEDPDDVPLDHAFDPREQVARFEGRPGPG